MCMMDKGPTGISINDLLIDDDELREVFLDDLDPPDSIEFGDDEERQEYEDFVLNAVRSKSLEDLCAKYPGVTRDEMIKKILDR